MLNELYSLSTVLKSKGISTKEWHREYKPLPKVTTKAPCIRIWIAKDGTISGMESISTEFAQSLRKFGNNQGTFPAFNIVPLYRVTDPIQISELERIEKKIAIPNINKIKTWCVNDNWSKSINDKVNRSLKKTSQTLSEIIGQNEQNERLLFVELIRLATSFNVEQNISFKDALAKCVFAMIQKQEDVDLALSVLIYKGDPQKDQCKDFGASISIILDLFDWKDFGYPVANLHTTEWVNERLLAYVGLNNSSKIKINGTDAFGTPFINLEEPMPSVKLSGFDVTLRSMFNGQPCQHRYGKADDASYPIAKGNRSVIKKSFEWIASIDRQGITWCKYDKNEIVFIYPSKLPEVLPKFVSILGSNRDENSVQTEARFENIAQEFIKAFRGISIFEKPDFIQIFTIRKMDKARSKVIFSRNCSPEQLIKAAENWESGCSNIPEAAFGERKIPYPLQVARIVNNVWKQNGEIAQGKTAVERMKYYQGIEILLDMMQKSMICNYLHILLINSSGLVNYLGNWVNGGAKCNDKIEEKNLERLKAEVILLLSVIGLLLDKNNCRKEKYMENTAYLIGQLLKTSDELHTLYCKVVRSGDIPPQLAGSALFVTAGENPFQAISQLSRRMSPYIVWAKQYRFKNIKEEGKESWKAGWYLKLFEDIANKLNVTMVDSIRFSDFEKAQLFVGYLASIFRTEPASIINDNGNNKGGFDNE